MRVKRLGRVLDVACVVLAFSGFMDFGLWLSEGYMIPSWTMTAMALGVVALLQVVKRLV